MKTVHRRQGMESTMDRIWLDHYPPGVPAEIDLSQYRSLISILDESFAKYRDAPAYVSMGRTLTYGDVDRMSQALGAWLQSRGLARGARIAIMMPNVLQYPIALIAILRAGYTIVNINPLYTARELQFQLRDSGAEAIFVLENFASTLQQVAAATDLKHIVVASLGEMLGFVKGLIVNTVVRHVKKMVKPFTLPDAIRFSDALSAGRDMTLSTPDLGQDDIACLQYTGGTTGVAKGATLLHRNLLANALQVDAWLVPTREKIPADEQLTIMTALPLYHIFALTSCLFVGMRIGARCILIANPRDLPNLIKEFVKYPVHLFPSVNTLFNGMLNHPDFAKINWTALRCAIGGGMAVQKAVADTWMQKTGKPIVEGYGLSETSPVLTCNRGDITAWNGTIGLPVPSTDVTIRDADDRDLPLGEIGEICARGPQVMAGYWQRPDETDKVMCADGFFRTGDIGVMDTEGRVRIVDRKKDMISVSGFKVFPNEVEDVAMGHPGVLECAAVGVPDPHSGEAVKLFVVKKDPDLTAEQLRKYCATQLTNYKVPKFIAFKQDLPKTPVGKVLRRELRDDPAEKPAA